MLAVKQAKKLAVAAKPKWTVPLLRVLRYHCGVAPSLCVFANRLCVLVHLRPLGSNVHLIRDSALASMKC